MTAQLPEQLCTATAVVRNPNHGPGSTLPQRALRNSAISTTDRSSSQVSKYSPQTALSLTTCWFLLQDALEKLFNGKHFREKDRGRTQRERERFKHDEAGEREKGHETNGEERVSRTQKGMKRGRGDKKGENDNKRRE